MENNETKYKKEVVESTSMQVVDAARISAEAVENSRISQVELAAAINRKEMRELLFEFFGQDEDPKRRKILIERVPFICEWIKENTEKTKSIHSEVQDIKLILKRVEPILIAYDESDAAKRWLSSRAKTILTTAGTLGAITGIVAFIRWILLIPK